MIFFLLTIYELRTLRLQLFHLVGENPEQRRAEIENDYIKRKSLQSQVKETDNNKWERKKNVQGIHLRNKP